MDACRALPPNKCTPIERWTRAALARQAAVLEFLVRISGGSSGMNSVCSVSEEEWTGVGSWALWTNAVCRAGSSALVWLARACLV